MRWPGLSSLPSHVRYRSSAASFGAATSRRYDARLPGCSRFVAGTSSRLSSSLGPSAKTTPATSGSCLTISLTTNVASPTASFAALGDAEALREARVRPHLAARRDALREAPVGIRLVRQRHGAAQRIAGADGLHVREDRGRGGSARRRIRGLHHAVEADHRRGDEPVGGGALGVRAGQRPVAADHEVPAQQQVGLPRERALDAIGEEADGAHAGHREDQRGDQHAQLARAPIPPQHPQRERKRSHRRAGSDPNFRPVMPCARPGNGGLTPISRRRNWGLTPISRRRRGVPRKARGAARSGRRGRDRA